MSYGSYGWRVRQEYAKQYKEGSGEQTEWEYVSGVVQ